MNKGHSQTKLRKGLWSPEEDEKLMKHIAKYGHKCWSLVPKQAGLQRCGKSCRLRWINYLRPDLKRGQFLQEEEDLIIKLHSMLGNRWAQIATQLPGRTDNEIKNFWNSYLRKKLKQLGIDPQTHKPLPQIPSMKLESNKSGSSCSSNDDLNNHSNGDCDGRDPPQQQQQQQQHASKLQQESFSRLPLKDFSMAMLPVTFDPSCSRSNFSKEIVTSDSGTGFLLLQDDISTSSGYYSVLDSNINLQLMRDDNLDHSSNDEMISWGEYEDYCFTPDHHPKWPIQRDSYETVDFNCISSLVLDQI